MTCNECRWFRSEPLDGSDIFRLGACTKHAPLFSQDSSGQNRSFYDPDRQLHYSALDMRRLWPSVLPDDFCGDFEEIAV